MLPDSAGDAPLAGLTRAGDGAGASSRRSEVQPAPLPFYRKLCYAIGGAPYQMTGNALGFFLQIFLLDVVQLEPFHSSLILFLGRAWDAVTDPAVGFLVSKSPRRKLGKLIPWIVFSTPFGVVFYCMVWFTPSDTMPVSLKFLWYLAMYCFFQTSMSCYHVPYSSLTMFLGGNQRDRDSATAYRMGVEVFSTLVGSGIQGQIVGRYHASMMESCSVLNGTLYNSTSPGLTDTSENTRRAYVIASVVLGSLYCMACLILFLGVKEQPGPLSPLGKAQLPFFHSLRIILGHQPYVWLLCGFLFMSLAFQVVASLSIPFWQWFLVRFGKKPAVFVGLSVSFLSPPALNRSLSCNSYSTSALLPTAPAAGRGWDWAPWQPSSPAPYSSCCWERLGLGPLVALLPCSLQLLLLGEAGTGAPGSPPPYSSCCWERLGLGPLVALLPCSLQLLLLGEAGTGAPGSPPPLLPTAPAAGRGWDWAPWQPSSPAPYSTCCWERLGLE
ncbi:sodium-dependent lysophosphatidylcholine symporter 1-like isoform 3-T3 [Macrochelys suwanniensis]